MLKCQLTSKWNEATKDEKQECLEKAEEACRVVCDIIARLTQNRSEIVSSSLNPAQNRSN